MRREPRQETKREPARPPDPSNTKGSGLKAAFREGREKGRPMTGKDPKAKGGDGMKAAMADKGKKPSKLSPMGGAKKNVR